MRREEEAGQGRLFEDEAAPHDLRQFDTLKGGMRLVAPSSLLPDPLVPCVCSVRHFKAGDVEEKMVGKVIEHPAHGPVFLHCHSGSQYHRKWDCPSPVDSILVAALQARSVVFYYAYDRQRKTLWRTTLAAIAAAPEEWFDNRKRFYLAKGGWQYVRPVTEAQQGRAQVYTNGQGAVLLNSPRLDRIVVLGEQGF